IVGAVIATPKAVSRISYLVARISPDARNPPTCARRDTRYETRDTKTASFVLPIRIVRVLEVPQRAAAAHQGDGLGVVRRRGGGGRPLERPRVPGIGAGRLTAAQAAGDVPQQEHGARDLEQHAERRQAVPQLPATARVVGVDAARHTE